MNQQINSAIDRLFTQAEVAFNKIAKKNQLVTWAEECNFARQAVERSTGLMECDPQSLKDAITNVAAVGLTLNPAYGYAYLIAEYNKDLGRKIATLRVSFKGLIALATSKSGPLLWCVADVVHQEDTFVYNGKWEKPTHEMANPFGDRGEPIGVYCVAVTKDNHTITELAPWSEVMKAKAVSKAKFGPWVDWEEEMAKKFIIKRASKQWPRASQHDGLQAAVAVLNEMEGSVDEIDQLDRTADAILAALQADDDESIFEAWTELTDDEKTKLSVVRSKGGWFSFAEKKAIADACVRVAQNRGLPGAPQPDPLRVKFESNLNRAESLANVESVWASIENEWESGELERGHYNELKEMANLRRSEFMESAE